MKTHSCSSHLVSRLIVPLVLVLWLLFLRDARSIKIEIGAAGHKSSDDLAKRATLSWDAVPGVLYTIQRSASVNGGGNNLNWLFGNAVVAESTNAQVEVSLTETSQFFRVAAPVQITSVEPSFIDSSNPNSVLYILGQLLPTNATVIINGQSFAATNDGSGLRVLSLNGLPPGEPVIGTLTVIDNGTSNVVATLPIQYPVVFGTNMIAEQWQGPPSDPPAAPLSALLMPALMKAKEKANRTKCSSNLRMAGLPDGLSVPGCCMDPCCSDFSISPSSGESQVEATDLFIASRGLDFAWTRTYRSRTGSPTVMGHNWDFSYNVSLAAGPNNTMILRTGDGRVNTFYPNGTNGWARDEYFCEIRLVDADHNGTPDLMEAVFSEGIKWHFNLLDPPGPLSGKLFEIVDRNSNTIRCEYDDLSGWLLRVVDTLDRTNTIAYNVAGLIESVTDFSGRTVRYEYDGNGDLVAVVSPPVTGTPTGNDFPGGKTNRYTYTTGNLDERLNHNLASCTDPKGQQWLQIFYRPTTDPANFEFDTVNGVLRGIGPLAHLRRYPQTPSPTNGYATVKAIMRDPVGNVTEEFYDSRGRCVRMLQYTGRAPFLGQPTTEIDNRPVNKLRADDPDYFDTRWTWNRDSLCTSKVSHHPNVVPFIGARMQIIYEGDFNAAISPRKKGDCRVIRQFSDNGLVDTDGDGVGDTSELTWQFDYDPRFGSGGKIVCNYVRREKTTLDGIDDWNVGDWAIYNGRDFEKNTENVSGGFGLIGGHGGGGGGAGGLHRKGWDGTIKGHSGRVWPRGPRQSTSLHGDYRASGETTPATHPWLVDTTKPDTALDVGFGSGLGRTDVSDVEVRYTAPGGRGIGSICTPICNDGFVTSVTDPRGVVSTATYDANGKVTQWQPHLLSGLDSPEIEFAYNASGQCVAITNAADGNGRRSVTRFVYGDDPFTPQAEPPVPFYFMSIEDDGGLQLTNRFEHDVLGRVTRAVNSSGHDWLFAWENLKCVRVQSPTNLTARCITDFIYDANDNLQRIESEQRDGNDVAGPGHVVLIGHDFEDRITSITTQVATNHFVTNRYEYDANGQLTAAYSPRAVTGDDPHHLVIIAYDECGRRFREIHGPGSGQSLTNEWSYGFNGKTKKAESTGGGQHVLHIVAYDTWDRLSSVTDPMSNVVSYVWDASGNLRMTRTMGELNDGPGSGNVRLSEWRGKYDGQNRLTQSQALFFNPATQSPIGDGVSLTTYTYAPNGQCLSRTDDNGRTTSYGYDTAGRLTSITGPNQKTSFAILLDPSGNPTNCTQIDRSDLPGPPQVSVQSYAYDSLNRCVADWDNVGNTNRYAYNSRGDLVRYIDPAGHITRYEYDGLSRKTRTFQDMNDNDILEAADVVITQTWDDNSRPASVTDDNTNTTYYAYNWMDCIVSITSPDGTGCNLVWSPRSNLILEQDARGTVISNTFDALDRCIRRDITPGPGVAPTTTFESFGYDGRSQMVAATNNTSFTITSRDSFGNCRTSSQDGWTVAYAYDGEGNCLSMTYPSGLVVTYTYNELNEVSSISRSTGQPPAMIAAIGYAGPGRVARINRANGTRTDNTWNGLVAPPNAPGDYGRWQRSGIGHTIVVGGAVIDRRIAAFDRNQNRILRAQTAPFSLVNEPATNIWSHDALNRMTESALFRANSVASKIFVLDGNGNRQMVISNGLPQPYLMNNTPPPGPADFQMNQYTITPFGGQAFDENGNLVSRVNPTAQLVYEYDFANRLVAVTDLHTGAPVPVASYAYDAMGRRVSKTVYPPVPALPETTEFVYGGPDDCDDRNDEIIETVRFGVTGQSFILDGTKSHDDEVVKTFTWKQVSGPFLMMSDGHDYYFHKDDLGNTLALTDASGNVVERYEYDESGWPQILTSDGLEMGTNASPVGNPFLFRGMEWDAENGLYLAKCDGTPVIEWTFEKGWPVRWASSEFYDPQAGQFLSRRGASTRDSDGLVFNVVNPRRMSNPWSGGGAGGIKSKEDVYVWKVRGGIKSKEDVYVWKVRSKSKEDVYVWKVNEKPKKPRFTAADDPPIPWSFQCAHCKRHQKGGHVTLMK